MARWRGCYEVRSKCEFAKGVHDLEFIHGVLNLEKKILNCKKVCDEDIGISYCAIVPAWLKDEVSVSNTMRRTINRHSHERFRGERVHHTN